jgi:hypothetical protein
LENTWLIFSIVNHIFSSNLPDQKTFEKGEKCPKFIKMGIKIITKRGK